MARDSPLGYGRALLWARLLFDSAERLAETPAGKARAVGLARLNLYRQAALTELSPPVLGASTDADQELDDQALANAVANVRRTTLTLLEAAEAPERAITAHHHGKVVRRAVSLIVALAFLAGVLVAATQEAEPAEDLAKGKPWRASSKYVDCRPELIDCGGVRTRIFFHTLLENEPWVEIDLGRPTEFSTVAVHNRTDAVQDRAVPLVLEVGDDQQSWRQLASQNEEFKVWKVKLTPTTARYLRLRAPRVTLLHLDAVKVFR